MTFLKYNEIIMKKQITSISFYTRDDMPHAIAKKEELSLWIKECYSDIIIKEQGGDVLVILGGDGTIVDAIHKYIDQDPLFLGLNMGHVGFLAAVREEDKFKKALEKVFQGDFFESPRMIAEASLVRDKKTIYSGTFFNDMHVQNLTGVSEIDVVIEDTVIQHVRGNGVLAATASGSTAYNMSAHGPIVMPDIECLVVTELLDHNTPTPSLVLNTSTDIKLHVKDFRMRGELISKKTGQEVDSALFVDGYMVEVLAPNDIVVISRAPKTARLIEIERNYFFKSLHQKFTFR